MLTYCFTDQGRALAAARRLLIPLTVVLVVLATSSWVIHAEPAEPGPYVTELAAWERSRAAGAPLPEADATPAEIADFFSALSPGRQRRLAADYPLVIGNLDGTPVTLRYRANRYALVRALKAERERMNSGGLSAAGLENSERRAHRFVSMLGKGRQILAFDPSGRGRAAEVFGDLDSADRISVVVPGVDTELLTFERTEHKYTAPAGMAEALFQRQRAQHPKRSTAVIAWADYSAPQGVYLSAATGERATEGADRLADILRGLPGTAPVALFCHSYGSVVCGVAAAGLPGRVSDIAVAGSPGMRAASTSELDTQARVWAMRTDNDWIADVPHLKIGPLGHGTDPFAPSFGARRLSADGADGHNGYFEPGSDSLSNMARIGAGVPASVGCAPTDPDCAPGQPCAVPARPQHIHH